ncbi:hypothetical protein CLV49_3290 [Labedella gwakjiensis]|uniref:Uncharacterized protein n=1 Tax=Labedella gwakjiensis TaxID=390269 RepID=A0A2P8H0A0_9MICO|nr:hypothetical protein [Labedella gwakjiensis]PSL39646.1 hypothetical protein CLV49_3290 [Labedella gwakjiensis]RUQ85964.1 hypothetical protein ELQ93_02805 [Labedella gwakjiensis]
MTLDGASLLATLYPIGVLILLVETRSLRDLEGPRLGRHSKVTRLRILFSPVGMELVLVNLGVFCGLGGTVIAAYVVAIGERPNAYVGGTIAIDGAVLAIAVYWFALRLLKSRFD